MAIQGDIQSTAYGPPGREGGPCGVAGDPRAEADQIIALAADLQALVDAGLIELRLEDAGEALCELTEVGKAVGSATDSMHNNKEEE